MAVLHLSREAEVRAEMATFFQRRPEIDWGNGLAERLLAKLAEEIAASEDDDSEDPSVRELLERAFEKLIVSTPASETKH